MTRACVAVQAGLGQALLSDVSALYRRISGLEQERDAARAQTVAAVTAEAAALRRLERDIHDGPQQRLVRLAMELGRAQHHFDSRPEAVRVALADAIEQTQEALEELRALSRGIAPPVLVDRGLREAVTALAARSTVPVELDTGPLDGGAGRLDAAAETAAYFVIAEALTNVAKHSHAHRCVIGLRHDDEDPAGLGDRRRGRRRGAGQGTRAAGAGRPAARGRRPAAGQQPHRRPDDDQRGTAVPLTPQETASGLPPGHPARGPLRIVVADDAVLLREGLVRLLTEDGHQVVAVVGDGPALVDAVLSHRPDVSVVDVRMPPTYTDEGLRAAITARAQVPGAAMLVLSQYVEVSYAADLLADGSGAVGYLLKDRVARVEEFLDALDRVARGATVLDPQVVAQVLAGQRRDDPLRALTARERELLGLMAEGHSNTAIAQRLVLSASAVEKHIGNVFAKLGLPPDDAQHRRVLAVLAYLRA